MGDGVSTQEKIEERRRKWRIANRKYRDAHPERAREISRKSAKKKRQKNGWRKDESYKTKYKTYARQKLRRAVKSGKIKELPCEVCNNTKVQGHHDDYSKPLEVVWLCAIHHAEKHTTGVLKKH